MRSVVAGLVIAVMMAAASAAYGADDLLLITTSGRQMVLMDTSSIQQAEAGKTSRFIVASADMNRYAVSTTQLDCENGRMRFLKLAVFDRDHQLVGQNDDPGSWVDIPTRSVGGMQMKAVCHPETIKESLMIDIDYRDAVDSYFEEYGQ